MKKIVLLLMLIFSPMLSYGLEPQEVLVIANRFVPDSVDIARYYMEKRGIPKANLVKVTTTEHETCSRNIYIKEIVEPVRKAVLKHSGIKTLVTVYGMPLKVQAPGLDKIEKEKLNSFQNQIKTLQAHLKTLENKKSEEGEQLRKSIQKIKNSINGLQKKDMSAAVDSELTLVLQDDYPLRRWQANPFFVGYKNRKLKLNRNDVLLVSRLDARKPEIVKRMIDDSLAAEELGLKGKAYFDGRYKRDNKLPPNASFYKKYDEAIYRAADRLKESNLLPVIVDSKEKLFQPGSAPDTALYVGWYSLSNYVDAFDWEKGSIGMHVASVECESLRNKRNLWCRRMLEDGASAVIGPVGEPYLQAFPQPEAFFGFLTDGYYTLVESYFLSQPYLSWRMILIGDPLYRPFKSKH